MSSALVDMKNSASVNYSGLGTEDNFVFVNFSSFVLNVGDNRVEVKIVSLIFLLIFVTGVTGNALVVYVFAMNKDFRTITNIFLLNLAIVDLVYLVVCCPFTTVKVFLRYWPFGNILCKLVTYMMVVCLAVNVMTLVAIGFDRLVVVVCPVKSKPYRNKVLAYSMVLIFWVVSFILFTPIFIIMREVRAFQSYCIEQLDGQSRVVYATLMFLMFYAIPQVFLGISYSLISFKLWNKKTSSEMTRVAIVTLKIKGKIVKLTFAIALAFAVCWLPMHIAAILNAKGTEASNFTYYLHLFAPCFAYTTVSLNPIIYCYMSKSFRRYLKAALSCRKSRLAKRCSKAFIARLQNL